MIGSAPSPPALSGIRIIDLTTVVFGPSATQVLADYGADVIKVETAEGDSTRQTGPSAEAGMSSLFLGSNRNKRSAVIDLKTSEGRGNLHALVDTADVFIHNIRPQKLQSLGLDCETLRGRNPRLIYAGLHGFGIDGPYAGRPAYDDVVQALGGAADLGRRQSGIPRYMPTILADKIAGQMAAHAVLAALYQRERTGAGQFVEIPMFECLVQFLLIEHMNARHSQPSGALQPGGEDDFGYRRTLAEWRRPYQTSDGYVCFMPYGDRDWRRFFTAAGLDHLTEDPRFATIGERTKNIEYLYRLLEQLMQSETSAHWLELGERLEIPCAPVNRLEDLEYDPHLREVEIFGSLPASDAWDFRYVRSPVRMSDSFVEPTLPPRLGQHTREILDALGVSSGSIPAVEEPDPPKA